MRLRTVTALFTVLIMLPFQALPETRSLTVMIYMAGSDLETRGGTASADIEEMMRAVPDDGEMNVVVMTGGSLEWRNGLDPDKNIVSLVTGEGLKTQWETPGVSMGEANTLRDFLLTASEAFPAEKYALILWSHGGGPLAGVCFDERYEVGGVMDGLTLEEMARALHETVFAKERLLFVGFDACMMASAEVAGIMAPYAEVMVASQEIEPSGGWDYSFLGDLSLSSGGAEAGKAIVGAFARSMEEEILDVAISCLDLTRWERVEKAMDELFGAIDARMPEVFGVLIRAREAAEEAGDRSEVYMDLVDLKDWAALLEEEGAWDAGPLREALEDLVIRSWTNGERVNGLSVYFPCWNKYDFSRAWGSVHTSLDIVPGLKRLTQDYAARWLPEIIDPDDEEALMYLWDDNYTDVTLAVSRGEETIKEARALILEETAGAFRQVWDRDNVYISDDEVFFSYHGEALYALDGAGAILTGPLSYRRDGNDLILQMRDGDGRAHDAVWHPDEDGSRYLLSGEEGNAGTAFVNVLRALPQTPRPFDEWPEAGTEECALPRDTGDVFLRFLPLYSVPDRAAVFEMTAPDGSLTWSEPLKLPQMAKWPLTQAPETRENAGVSLTLKETALYVQADRCLSLTFGAALPDGGPVTLVIEGMSIDGVDLPEALVSRSLRLEAGKETELSVLIPSDTVSELGLGQCSVLEVRGHAVAAGGDKEDAGSTFGFPYHLGMLGRP